MAVAESLQLSGKRCNKNLSIGNNRKTMVKAYLKENQKRKEGIFFTAIIHLIIIIFLLGETS